eukprot:TRINITY_DN9182_c0_g2_i2.p1 TRINITY_DN9182_c0_g2~~TRINITY_DN9182_c0_g2_i2.p1  ORF type:complete len:496 (+),score=150.90 TRINITY_DN9182_c0_g2_i2:48-1490(+)
MASMASTHSLRSRSEGSDTGAVDALATGHAVTRRHWVSDKETKNCSSCGQSFTIMRRRHHCRSCGDVFCSECTRERQQLHGAQGRMDGRFGAASKGSRVCVQCAADYEQDKNHAVYRLLGPNLGPKFFYSFIRNGDCDVEAMQALSPRATDALAERNGLKAKDRVTLIKALLQHSIRTSSQQRAEASRSPLWSDDEVPPPQQAASPERPAKRGRGFGSAKDLRLRRRALAEELDSLDQRMRSAHAELSSLAARRKEEEAKIGKIQDLDQELTYERERRAFRERDRSERRDRGESAAHHEVQSRVSRRCAFSRKRHHRPSCDLCMTRYTTNRREHHCRMCYRSCCGPCSTSRALEGRRLCDWCHVEHAVRSPEWVNRVAKSEGDRSRWISFFDETLELLLRLDGCGPSPARQRRRPAQVLSSQRSATDSSDQQAPGFVSPPVVHPRPLSFSSVPGRRIFPRRSYGGDSEDDAEGDGRERLL